PFCPTAEGDSSPHALRDRPGRVKLEEWWQDPESNRGHKDFQSSALPTELSCQSRTHIQPGPHLNGKNRFRNTEPPHDLSPPLGEQREWNFRMRPNRFSCIAALSHTSAPRQSGIRPGFV